MGLSQMSDQPTRQLILHADDFGMNRPVTDGIVRGFTYGLLTSTAVLANAPDTDEALKAWGQLEQRRLAGRLPSAASPAASATYLSRSTWACI